ncbi:MAG: acyl-CoA thioesterase domain-containing protein, partial [Aquihabitans sp.]
MVVASPSADTLHEFDVATTVKPGAVEGTYDLHVDAGFTVGPKPNGGYLLACVARAAGEALAEAGSTHHHALAATAHYLGAPDPGPATIEIDILRQGRGASQVRGTLSQAGTRCVDVTRTMGTLPAAGTAPVWSSVQPFEVAPRD